MTEIEMSAAVGAMIVSVAAAQGANTDALLAATGFDPDRAHDPDARIALSMEEALWNEAARLTGDDAFGLHAAEALRPGAFDVLDYAVRTAPTLRVSLERLARYNRLVHDVAVFSLIPRSGVLRVEHGFRVGAGLQCRHSAEFTLASLVVIGGQLLGQPLRVLAAELHHAKPRSAYVLAEHRRVFGMEPRFSAKVNALELDATQLDQPLPQADAALWRVIERHADALLSALPPPTETFGDRVRRLLANTLADGTPTLGQVADQLKMSERSLQRKLADEDLSFDTLLDELRRVMAVRYLADPKVGIAEVAYLLGYSEPSPFHRAFKRWTGVTPAEARRQTASM